MRGARLPEHAGHRPVPDGHGRLRGASAARPRLAGGERGRRLRLPVPGTPHEDPADADHGRGERGAEGMSGRYCEKHEEWAPTGECRWCEPAPLPQPEHTGLTWMGAQVIVDPNMR